MNKLVKILVISLLALSMVACGVNNSPNGNNDNNTGNVDVEQAQGVSDTEIVIANCAAISGGFAPIGVPFVAGINAYIEKVNADGGVNGRQITFKHSDDEFDPAKGKACLQDMIEDEEVFAIVGHFGTPVVAATLEDLKEYGIPTVYFATGIGQLFNENAQGRDRIIYPVQPIYVTEGQVMVARGVGDYDAEKIGVIYTNDDAGKDMLKGAELKAAELGVELVSEQVAAGATDVSAAVTSIMNAEVDFIIGAAIQVTIPTIIKALAAQGNTANVITTYVNVQKLITDAVATDIEGKFDVLGNGWVSMTQDKSLEEMAVYAEYIDEEFALNAYAMTGWIAAHFFTEGLRNMDPNETITWEGYMDALESKPIDNPFGGSIDFSDGKRYGTDVMNLSKIDPTQPAGWLEVKPLESISDILGN